MNLANKAFEWLYGKIKSLNYRKISFIRLNVLDDNPVARRIYEKEGFQYVKDKYESNMYYFSGRGHAGHEMVKNIDNNLKPIDAGTALVN
jgi:hypothetical protein